MNYVKKMCVLRQIKQGFSADGKALSGLIKAEQYGKNLSVEVSVINFAPLSSGEYFCLIADEKERCELLPLRGKSLFNVVSDLDLSNGFCGVICFVKTDIVPLAYGVNGTKTYDFKTLLSHLFQEAKKVEPERETGISTSINKDETVETNQTENTETEKERAQPVQTVNAPYDDERLASENYYSLEKENEPVSPEQTHRNAYAQSGTEREEEKTGENAVSDADDQNVRAPFATEPDGYYLSVKNELDELFRSYPKDERLKETFPYSEWVKIEENGKDYSVGVIYENLKAKYICYALPAKDKNHPPEEIKDVCAFVPVSPFEDAEGFFVLFQSTATGECLPVKNG
ncbi:MAG: hypothetical protein IIX01_04195 [Clostridia bacterium]|nr:hypothetical protein [Clostridia bacterium]